MKPGQWSKMVKERDGACVKCGRAEDLHAHHIKPKSTHPELRFDLANGMTLCYRCHKAEHERMGRVRVRSERPQRKTLLRRIAQLETTLERLKAAVYEKAVFAATEKDRISRESLEWARKNREAEDVTNGQILRN